MGLLTWVVIGIVVLAVIGLGVGTFFSGVSKGLQTVGNNPVVKNATGEAKQFIGNITNQKANDFKNAIVKNGTT
jgi:hypothetical protein